MFSFFKKKHAETQGIHSIDREISPTRMTLEERKAWRSNMLCKSIHDVFLSLGISPEMYKYRITPTDERGHYYAVMIETLRIFSSTEYTTTKKLLDIEIILKTRTFDNYGIVVVGIFWKTDETIDLFDSTKTSYPHSTKHKKTIQELREIFLDKDRTTHESFIVGDKTYDTDLAPLRPE